jgi:outer membrane protein assembly factor BamD (BamD/ComL family)
MQGKVKIKKRQIKEDKFTTFMLTAKDRVIENWVPYAVGVLAVVVAIVAVIYYFNSQEATARDASERYSEAVTEYRNGNEESAILTLQSVINDYGGSRTGEQATYMLARIHLLGRNYPEAMRYFETYLDKYKDNPLHRAASLAGIAVSYENQGEPALAAENFEKAIAAYPTGPNVADYHLGAMRNFLQTGDEEAAREHMRILQEEFAGTQWEQNGLRLFYEHGLTLSANP